MGFVVYHSPKETMIVINVPLLCLVIGVVTVVGCEILDQFRK